MRCYSTLDLVAVPFVPLFPHVCVFFLLVLEETRSSSLYFLHFHALSNSVPWRQPGPTAGDIETYFFQDGSRGRRCFLTWSISFMTSLSRKQTYRPWNDGIPKGKDRLPIINFQESAVGVSSYKSQVNPTNHKGNPCRFPQFNPVFFGRVIHTMSFLCPINIGVNNQPAKERAYECLPTEGWTGTRSTIFSIPCCLEGGLGYDTAVDGWFRTKSGGRLLKSHYCKVFIHPRWLFGIGSTNSMSKYVPIFLAQILVDGMPGMLEIPPCQWVVPFKVQQSFLMGQVPIITLSPQHFTKTSVAVQEKIGYTLYV